MEHDEAIKNFCDIANCDAERAKFFLSAANWELEVMIGSSRDYSTTWWIHNCYAMIMTNTA